MIFSHKGHVQGKCILFNEVILFNNDALYNEHSYDSGREEQTTS